MEDVNYKELLKKYMIHVLEEEGVDFVFSVNTNMAVPVFTEEEVKVLENISHEIN